MDTSKAIGIILVVIGHVLAAAGPDYRKLEILIFLFHMPLFFMISGAMHKDRGLSENARRRFRGLPFPASPSFFSHFFDAVISFGAARQPQVWSFRAILGLVLGGSFGDGKIRGDLVPHVPLHGRGRI